MSAFVSSFKESLKYAPAVLKDASLYYGLYFFIASFIILALLKNTFELSYILIGTPTAYPMTSFFKNTNDSMVILINSLFFAFAFINSLMVPYYAFKRSKGSAPKFLDFIDENLWILVLSKIKAVFICLLFALLLIIPGLYKSIRYIFVTETVLFDKQNKRPILEQADLNTRGWFWPAALFWLLYYSPISISWIAKGVDVDFTIITIAWAGLILSFYLNCFLLLWKTHFFFEIKKKKGEPISL